MLMHPIHPDELRTDQQIDRLARDLQGALSDGLLRLGLNCKHVALNDRNNRRWYSDPVYFSRYLYDRRPGRRVIIYKFARLIGSGTFSPTLKNFNDRRAAELLSGWIQKPVRIYSSGENEIAIAVALSGDEQSFLSKAELEAQTRQQRVEPLVETPFIPEEAGFLKYISDDSRFDKQGDMQICLGVGAQETILSQSLSRMAHVLVAAATNGGKSTLLRSLFSQGAMAELEKSGTVRMAVIDRTTVTFNPLYLDGLPQFWTGMNGSVPAKVMTGRDDIMKLIWQLHAEIERRNTLYAYCAGGVDSLPKYNAACRRAGRDDLQLPGILVFIEEISRLAEEIGEVMEPLRKVLLEGRKDGVNLIMGGQSWTGKTIDIDFVRNSLVRLALGGVDWRVRNALGFDSKIHQVSKVQPGRGLAWLHGQVSEFQGLLLPDDIYLFLINELRAMHNLKPAGTTDWDLADQLLNGKISPVEIRRDKPDENEETKPDELTKRPGEAQTEQNMPALYQKLITAWNANIRSVRDMATELGCGKTKAAELINRARDLKLIVD